jgi:hypothetical protein
MAKSSKQKRRDERTFFGIIDFVDFAMNFLPGKALTALLIVGAVGGVVGHGIGVDSVIIPEPVIIEIPDVPECPDLACPEPTPCPECEDCKTLDDYTDEELIEALKPRYVCYPTDSID